MTWKRTSTQVSSGCVGKAFALSSAGVATVRLGLSKSSAIAWLSSTLTHKLGRHSAMHRPWSFSYPLPPRCPSPFTLPFPCNGTAWAGWCSEAFGACAAVLPELPLVAQQHEHPFLLHRLSAGWGIWWAESQGWWARCQGACMGHNPYSCSTPPRRNPLQSWRPHRILWPTSTTGLLVQEAVPKSLAVCYALCLPVHHR